MKDKDQEFYEFLCQLDADVEDAFPSGRDGGSSAFMMRNAATILVSRCISTPNLIVPVFFIFCRRGGENCSGEVMPQLFEGTGHKALVAFSFEGKRLGKSIIAPFLYYRQYSSTEFIEAVEQFLAAKRSEMEVVWLLDYCRVDAIEQGMSFSPSENYLSLCL